LANGAEIISYKSLILSKLLNDKDVCQLILNRQILDMDDADMQTEVERYIRPYWYIPYTQTDAATYITFDIGGFSEGQGDIHKKANLGVFLFSHVSLEKCNFAPYKTGIRTDHLNVAVQSIFNGSYDFGIGEMKLLKDNPRQINEMYYGRELTFQVSDWSGDGQKFSVL